MQFGTADYSSCNTVDRIISVKSFTNKFSKVSKLCILFRSSTTGLEIVEGPPFYYGKITEKPLNRDGTRDRQRSGYVKIRSYKKTTSISTQVRPRTYKTTSIVTTLEPGA